MDNNTDFEQIIPENHLKELALNEIYVAAKECISNGYQKDMLLEVASLSKQFADKFDQAAEIPSLVKLLEALNKKRQEILSATPKTPEPPITTTNRSVDDYFPIQETQTLPDNTIFNTAIIENNNFYQDNTILLYSPFEEELVHLYTCYAAKTGKALRIVDIAEIISKYSGEASAVLSVALDYAKVAENDLIVILNPEKISADRNVEITLWEYLYAIRKGAQKKSELSDKSSTEILILSTDLSFGVEARYNEYIKKEYTLDSALDKYLYSIITDFIPLVSREKTLSVLRYYYELSDSDEKFTKALKNGIFLGWSGLSEVVSKLCDKDELIKKLEKYKSERENRLKTFIEISNQGLSRFDPLDWDYTTKKKASPAPIAGAPNDRVLNPVYTLFENQYDHLISNEQISQKLEVLMNVKNVPLVAKCAWAADFAMKGGDQLNLINLPPECEKSTLIARWDLAFHAVARLLWVDVPRIVFDLPANGITDGICCDGGTTIRMNKKFLSASSVDDGISTLLHEMYHAVQHSAESALSLGKQDVLDYYLHHLNISVFHIQQWKKNFSRYRDTNPSFDDYYDQVVEADARIFSADAISSNGRINHPRLDVDKTAD